MREELCAEACRVLASIASLEHKSDAWDATDAEGAVWCMDDVIDAAQAFFFRNELAISTFSEPTANLADARAPQEWVVREVGKLWEERQAEAFVVALDAARERAAAMKDSLAGNSARELSGGAGGKDGGVVKICGVCGSADVTADAIVTWSVANQAWEIAGLLDANNCNACCVENSVVDDLVRVANNQGDRS